MKREIQIAINCIGGKSQMQAVRRTEMDALKRVEYWLIAAVVLVAIIAGIQSVIPV
jgi:Flp pilus assembly pilin Flp